MPPYEMVPGRSELLHLPDTSGLCRLIYDKF